MGGGQPDMQGEGARLGSKADENEDAGGPQDAPVLQGGSRRPHGVKVQGAQLVVEQKQSRQGGQTADHRHSQVGVSRLEGVGLLGLNDRHKGGKGHDLKENKGGKQVGGQEHAHGGPQGHEPEEIVPVLPGYVGHVLPAENGGRQPACGSEGGHEGMEIPGDKADTKAAEAVDAPLHHWAGPQGDHHHDLQHCHHQDKGVPGLWIAQAHPKSKGPRCHRQEHQHHQQIRHTLSLLSFQSSNMVTPPAGSGPSPPAYLRKAPAPLTPPPTR